MRAVHLHSVDEAARADSGDGGPEQLQFPDGASNLSLHPAQYISAHHPMSVLVGVLLGLSRLAADSEITAMRASGFGIWYFVRVSSIIAILGTAIGLINSLYIEPDGANQAILDLQKELETSQASFEIQPRVFYEDFKNTVVYVQNVLAGTGASHWQRLLIADVSDPTSPGITTAESATVAQDKQDKGHDSQGMLIQLRNGSQHDMVANQPGQYNITTFAVTDRPLTFSPQSEVSLGRLDTPLYALGNRELWGLSHGPEGKRYLIELNRRFAYPLACMVLMLIGVPLGTAARRGGKSSGIHLHHPAGAGVLPAIEFRHCLGQARTPASVHRRLAGKFRLRRSGPLSAKPACHRRCHVLSFITAWFRARPSRKPDDAGKKPQPMLAQRKGLRRDGRLR
jgi:lipopolysaccharide export LptBFGC system permease protein LptF